MNDSLDPQAKAAVLGETATTERLPDEPELSPEIVEALSYTRDALTTRAKFAGMARSAHGYHDRNRWMSEYLKVDSTRDPLNDAKNALDTLVKKPEWSSWIDRCIARQKPTGAQAPDLMKKLLQILAVCLIQFNPKRGSFEQLVQKKLQAEENKIAQVGLAEYLYPGEVRAMEKELKK